MYADKGAPVVKPVETTIRCQKRRPRQAVIEPVETPVVEPVEMTV
jgi:hypothetical protein